MNWFGQSVSFSARPAKAKHGQTTPAPPPSWARPSRRPASLSEALGLARCAAGFFKQPLVEGVRAARSRSAPRGRQRARACTQRDQVGVGLVALWLRYHFQASNWHRKRCRRASCCSCTGNCATASSNARSSAAGCAGSARPEGIAPGHAPPAHLRSDAIDTTLQSMQPPSYSHVPEAEGQLALAIRRSNSAPSPPAGCPRPKSAFWQSHEPGTSQQGWRELGLRGIGEPRKVSMAR